MNIKQAFEIMSRAGGARAARIITDGRTAMPAWRVWLAAWRLRRDVPVAKIVGRKWFYGLPFYTNAWTLDPRPDTETLVSAVLAETETGDRILDLGTGTGCVIAAIVKNMPNVTGVGVDKSRHAIRVAKKNVKKLQLENRIKMIHADFLSPISCLLSPFDVIVSNPPYIANGDLRVDAGAAHDPKMALYAGADGLDAYRAIAKNAKLWLKQRGNMYLEIGTGQGMDVKNIFIGAGWNFVRSWNDLSGIERVLCFTYFVPSPRRRPGATAPQAG